MLRKRITPLIIVITMLTTLLPSGLMSVANAATVKPGEVILADFSGGSIPDDVTVTNRNETVNTASKIDTSVSFNGESSLAYKFDTKSTHIVMPYDSEAYSVYDTFNVRVYSKIPGQKINFIVNEQNTATSSADKGVHLKVIETTGEWQVYSVSIATIAKAWASTPENLYVLLNCSAWYIYPGTKDQLGETFLKSGKTYTYASIKGEYFHIDRIWLSDSTYSPYMKEPTLSVANGAVDVDASSPGFTYTAAFDDEIDTYEIEKKISVAKNGEEYTDYSIDCTANEISLIFNSPLEGMCTYSVTFDATLEDNTGKTLGTSKTYTFKTAREKRYIESDGVIFDVSSEPDRLDALVSESDRLIEEIVTDNTFSGESSYKLTYPKAGGTEFVSLKHGDISGWTYMNYLIYNPEAKEDYMRLLIDAEDVEESGDSSFIMRLPLDWEGWKLFSFPLSDYTVSRSAELSKITGHRINFGGWGDAMTDAGYIQINRIWLSNEPAGSLGVVSAEYENEQDFVDVNIGGDNAYTITFEKELMNRDYSDSVCVYEKSSGGEFALSDIDYDVTVEENELKVEFSSALESGITYKITIDSMKLVSTDYIFNAEGIETIFTVGTAAPYFYITNVSVENGAENVTPSAYEIEFNHEPADCDVADFVSLYADGIKQYNAFKAEKKGTKLVLSFTSSLSAGTKYRIAIDGLYSDIYGNNISGDTEFTFTTPGAEEKKDVVTFFTASDDDAYSAIIKNNVAFSEETSNVNLHDKAVRLDYIAGKDRSSYPYKGADVDVSNMKYINFWMYSPKALDEGVMVFVAYTDRDANKGITYQVALDWEGWKLISIPQANVGNYDIIDAINFNFDGWGTTMENNGYVLFDELWASKELPSQMELEASTFPNGFSSAAVSGQNLVLTFSDKINTKVLPVLNLTDENGAEITDYTVEYDGSDMKLCFGRLEPSTSYSLKISGITGSQPVPRKEDIIFTFATEAENIYLDGIDFSKTSADSDSECDVTFKVSNLSGNVHSLEAVVYVTDEDNRLLFTKKAQFAAPANDEAGVNITAKCPEGASKIIAYAVTSTGAILSDRYFILDSSGAKLVTGSPAPGNAASVKLDEAELSVNVLKISGRVNAVSDIVRLTVGGGRVMSEILIKAGSNGSFESYYVFPADALSGDYTVTAESEGVSDTADIKYISKAHRNTMVEYANGTSESALSEFVRENGEALGLGKLTKAQADDIAKIVIESDDFDSYADVISFIGSIRALVNKINTSKWNALGDVVEKNTLILGENDKDIKYFLSLSEKNRNKVCEIIAGSIPVDTIGEFKEVLSDAIDKYKDSLQDSGNSGSGGGGGGGSGRPVSSVSYPENFVKPDSYTPIEANNVFADLSEAEWAKSSVMTLYKSGIISHPSDGRFRPNDNITREEFVKMLVCAFATDATSASHRFSDEAEGMWYNEYLAKAYASGITLGYPDGSFGIGRSITREEMVTLCARTLETLGVSINSDADVHFTDSAYISDYALGYVSAMAGLGVVNGMGNGSFAPKNTATRAEAAKVIARLTELY